MGERFRKRRGKLTPMTIGFVAREKFATSLPHGSANLGMTTIDVRNGFEACPPSRVARSCKHGQVRGLHFYTIAANTKSERIPRRS